MSYIFTSESVSEGHPDKVADQISDAILDAYLEKDRDAKVACESLITTGNLIITGEVKSKASVDAVAIAKDVIRKIGYHNTSYGFDYATAKYTNLLHEQSPEINHSLIDGGAGDQGLMFGYACDETPELMPLPIILAHRLVERQSLLRKNGTIEWLLPDAKSQVSVLYHGNKPDRVVNIILSTQHKEGISQENIHRDVCKLIIEPLIEQYLAGSSPSILVNPSGSFTIGGPHADTGLTGRKIIVDTYGGSCSHGGGAFSGKDPSKVDRSGAYAARYIAKHIVASGIARRCTIQISYAIGIAEPISLYVSTHGTGKIEDNLIEKQVRNLFDLTPGGIVRTLNLKQPIYFKTAAYGHFGKPELPWEIPDQKIIAQLKKQAPY